MFGDVKFVCVGGTLKRMESFAYFVGQELGIKLPTGVTLKDITQNAHRYSMFKIGPVLSVTVSIFQNTYFMFLYYIDSHYIYFHSHYIYFHSHYNYIFILFVPILITTIFSFLHFYSHVYISTLLFLFSSPCFYSFVSFFCSILLILFYSLDSILLL